MSAVHDAEQLENAKAFFNSYGKPILLGVVIALAGYGGWTYWQNSQEADAQLNTVKIQKLINETSQIDETTTLAGFVDTANQISTDSPNSVHAIQAQFIIADKAYQRKDYATAEQALAKVANSKNDDEGLVAIAKLRLANAQVAQENYDDALAVLNGISVAEFKATAEERKGDIFVAKNDIESAKTAYQTAWDHFIQREDNQDSRLLRMKLESVGILVEAPVVELPVIQDTTTAQ